MQHFKRYGKISELTAADRTSLFDRSTSSDPEVCGATASIIDRVRREGDAALIALAAEFDRVRLTSLEVPRAARQEALAQLDPALRRAMQRAAGNIVTVHRASLPASVEVSPEPGIRIVRRPDPLRRVGVYAPGGRASYPSSVLMGAIPARVAGVEEVILCSPPGATGLPSGVVLAAAEIAGVDQVFSIGGAGAIAAMAFGTQTIARVDRIVGPGNSYVAEAKRQVAGVTGIDAPAGPSELLVIANGSASARGVALEVLAQAEHDPKATVVIVTIGEEPAAKIAGAIAELLPAQPRAGIIELALKERGAILVAASVAEAIAFANDFAPEHLLLALPDANSSAARCRNAGTIFLGLTSSVAFGDYMAGANHVLPTGGLARSYSGLSVSDFFRWTTVQSVNARAAASLSDDVAIFAAAEGLPAHAAAARQWGPL